MATMKIIDGKKVLMEDGRDADWLKEVAKKRKKEEEAKKKK